MIWTLLAVAAANPSFPSIGVQPLQGGTEADAAAVEFAPPRRVLAGEATAGLSRFFPSPVLHDVDGDGARDLVVADLFGRLTVARGASDAPGRFAGEEPLMGRDGERLKFDNW